MEAHPNTLEAAWLEVEELAQKQHVRESAKRAVDVPAAMLGLMLTGPMVLVAAAALALDLKEPPLIRQQRAGRLGKPFGLIKLRTMRTVVDGSGNLLPNEHRRSRLGDVIRKLSIDELPQLLNVLLGDISLVGPRPLWQEYVASYRLHELKRLALKPGITGLAQVSGRNAVGWDERFALDTEYCRSSSLIMADVMILVRTVAQAFRFGQTAVDQSRNLIAVRTGGSFSPPIGFDPDRCPPDLMAPSVRSGRAQGSRREERCPE